MADEDDTLAESIREETTGGEGQEEGGESEQEEAQEGTEGEGESEETTEGEEEGEAEEAEASGPGDEEESEEDEGEGERTQSRGRNRVQKLAEERNRLRAENEELRRRASGGGQGGGAAAPTNKTPQQVREEIRAQAVKAMDGLEFKTPEQRADAVMGVVENIVGRVFGPLQFSAADTQDQTRFSRQYGNNPLYKRLSSKVEEQVMQARSQGQFIPREIIFKNLVGDEALRQVTRNGGKQRRAAEGRKAAAAGVSTKGKGDSTSTKEGGSFVQRYEREFGNRKI